MLLCYCAAAESVQILGRAWEDFVHLLVLVLVLVLAVFADA
jgi:hypothetical protein